MKISSRYEFFYPFLAIASIILIIWHHFGMNKTLKIYPEPTQNIVNFNDHINGGISIGISLIPSLISQSTVEEGRQT